jgi:hypothetical protein
MRGMSVYESLQTLLLRAKAARDITRESPPLRLFTFAERAADVNSAASRKAGTKIGLHWGLKIKAAQTRLNINKCERAS